VLVGAVAGGWWFARSAPDVAIPEINSETVDPAVADAISAARAAVVESRASADDWGHLGMVLQAHDYASAAETCFAQAERLDPDDARWPYLRGVGLAVRDPAAAIELYRRAAALPGGRPWAELRLGELLIDADRTDEAVTHFAAVLEHDPADARAMLGMARAELRQGNEAAALAWAQRSARQAPAQRATHELLAQIYFRQGDRKAAQGELALLERLPEEQTTWRDPPVEAVLALRRGPNTTAQRAQELIQRGRPQQGIAMLEELVKRHPEAEEYRELGQALIEAGAVQRAHEVLTQALAQHPGSPELSRLGGIVAFTQGRWQQAAELFQKTALLKPDDAIAHYNLGHALMKLGDEEAARAAFRDAVASKPEFANAHINLGKLLLAAGRPEEARPHILAAVALAPDDAVAQALLEQLPDP
jgi:Flp pilus assembly protein TadD